MDEMNERSVKAIERYLRVKGYTIHDMLPLDDTQVIVAQDAENDALAFVQCLPARPSTDDFAVAHENDRSSLEHLALGWLADHDDAWGDNQPVRFDAVALLVLGDHRALLRHHKGAFSAM